MRKRQYRIKQTSKSTAMEKPNREPHSWGSRLLALRSKKGQAGELLENHIIYL
ncbi:MAG: hypothetical protein Q4F17_00995 [Eubacteriales bacterium]|nr:hypothetical protein [Eubacteriales bacterium]